MNRDLRAQVGVWPLASGVAVKSTGPTEELSVEGEPRDPYASQKTRAHSQSLAVPHQVQRYFGGAYDMLREE